MLSGLAATAAAQAQLAAPEVQVTTAAVPDFEFDSARDGLLCETCNRGDGNSRLAFSTRDGQMWLGEVDYRTGGFLPTNGKGVLVDVRTAPVACFGNGPEWMSSAAGSQIVYTRFIDDAPFAGTEPACEASRAQVVVASQTGATTWSPQALPALDRVTPDGSKDTTDPNARVNYIETHKTQVFWSQQSALNVEVEMPINDLTGGNSRRWVAGTRQVVFQGHESTDPRLLDQVWLYDTDTGKREKLTFDSVSKAGAFMWRAPEFNNEFVFFTMANFRRELWVYRNLLGPKGQRYWTIAKRILAPKNPTDPSLSQFFWSPEVFTHNGRSYIFTQVSESSRFFDTSIPTHLAISGIDPLRNDFRMLTSDAGGKPPRVRLDPEYFITAQGPFIYYNRLIPANEEYPDGINDGVWRVDTRLGAPRF